LHEMGAAGVDAAVIVSAGINGNPDNNDYVAAAVAAHPGRLHQLVDFDSRWTETYHTPGSAGRLEALVDRHTPLGISHYLGPDNDGWLDSDEARAVVAAAEARGLVIGLAAGPSWFDDICVIAQTTPSVPILLNHLALVMQHPDGTAAGLDAVKRGANQH